MHNNHIALHEILSDDLAPIPESPAPEPPSTLRYIFFGPEGLRSGWGLLSFILIFALLIATSNFVAKKAFPKHFAETAQKRAAANTAPSQPAAPDRFFLGVSIPFAFVCLTTFIMSKLERRPIAVYGIGRRNLAQLFIGFFWGVLCLSLLILALWKTHLLVFDSRLLFGTSILRYGVIWFAGFLLVGIFEEYLTRGYLQYTLTRALTAIYGSIFKSASQPTLKAAGFWTAGILFSLLFGLGHSSNPGESPIGLLSAGLAALVFIFSLWRTGSLLWAIGFHATWDWAQSFLYGVADSGTMVQGHLFATHPTGTPLMSGGLTGPEGSIFILPILALVALIIHTTLPPRPIGNLQPVARTLST